MTLNNHNQDTPLIWALLDDRAGNRSQCLGVAQATGLPFISKEVRYSAFAKLPNWMIGSTLLGLTMESRLAFRSPWPDVVIAAGRRTAPIARAIKKRNAGKSHLCQIMYPGDSGASDFDLIAVPTHDEVKTGNNILPILGAPHGITRDKLSQASQEWRDELSSLAAPRIAVLVGGSTRRRSFTTTMAQELGQRVNEMAKKANASIMLSTSRRTGTDAEEAMFREFTVPHQIFRWGQQGENPYLGYLALADCVVVTGDSVSMCSEVCATESPVYIYAPDALITDKHARLHQQLYSEGYARPLTGEWQVWTHPALNSAETISEAIKSRLELF